MKKICEHCRKYFLLFVCLSCVVFSSVSVAHAAGEVEIISGLLMEMIRAEINPEDANAGEDYAVLMRKFFRTSHAGGTLEVTYDQLQEMCVSLNASGIPCEIVRSNVGYSIRCTGEIVGYDWPINITGCYFSNSDGEVFVAPTSTNKLLILEDIREFVSTIASRLQYTTSDGTTYTAGRLLNIISNRITEVRDNLATIDTKLTDLSDDVNAMRDYLSMIAGTGNNSWLQQIRDKLTSAITELTTANTKLDSLIGYVDGLEDTLSNSAAYLKMLAYGEQDIYSTLGTIAGEYRDATAAEKAAMDAILDNYWQTSGTEGAKLYVTGDRLREMQTNLVEVGYPCVVTMDSNSGVYVLRLGGGPRVADVFDYSYTGQSSGMTLYDGDNPMNFTLGGLMVCSTSVGSENLISQSVTLLNTVSDKLDTVIDEMSRSLTAEVTVDIGDVTLSTDDTAMTAYLKMLAYGDQTIYSTLGTIAGEYRDATTAEKTAMDIILDNYWYTAGTEVAKMYVTGDRLREMQAELIAVGYPTMVVKDDERGIYVLRLGGGPRVADVFDYSYTGKTPGLALYDASNPLNFTLGGLLICSTGAGSESLLTQTVAHLSTMSDEINSGISDHQAALLDALDGLSSDLATYYSGESFYLDGLVTFSMDTYDLLDEKLPALETTLSTVGTNIVTAIEDAAVVCPHEYTSQVVVEPSCELPGVTKYTCGLCSAFYYEDVAALGHSWTNVAGGDAVTEEEYFPIVEVNANEELDLSGFPVFIPGDLYRVSYNGEEYLCRAINFVAGSAETFVYLGDFGAVAPMLEISDYPSTGEPFVFLFSSENGSGFVFGDDGSTINIGIYHVPEVAVREEVLLANYVTKGGNFSVDGMFGLSLGDRLRVNVNGYDYEVMCNAYMVSNVHGLSFNFGFGNPALAISGLYDDTGEPFFFVAVHNSSIYSAGAGDTISVYHKVYDTPSAGGDTSSFVRTCTRCHAGEDMAALVGFLDAKLDALESALANAGDIINIENNTNIDISEENESYNIFFVEDTDGEGDQSIIDLSGDALTVFGKLLNFLYQVGFKDALDGAGPGIGDLSDFYLDDSEGSVDLWAS